MDRKAFLQLPMSERRRLLKEQVERLAYQCPEYPEDFEDYTEEDARYDQKREDSHQ